MQKRGQSSFEYIILVGLTTFMVLGLLGVYNYYTGQVEDTINANQVDFIAKLIIDDAESMFYLGAPSKTTIKIYMPDNIKNISIYQNEITFKVKSGASVSDFNYLADVLMQGGISSASGLKEITIESRGSYVWINGT